MPDPSFAVAVFPFLKTSGPVRIGGHLFRATTDVSNLQPEEAKAVTDIAQMLFVQGDLRVRSASYAVIPSLEIHGSSDQLTNLAHLRAVLCYIYASPHAVFDDVFLSPEEASLVLLKPSPVNVLITRSEHHTESVAPAPGPPPNGRHEVPGYAGLYNFRHYFFVEAGSRLYGPKPHIVLNISQDLSFDLEQGLQHQTEYHLLLALLEKPLTPAARRVFCALEWFNAANEDGVHPDRSLLNLAVAFEALLRLPDSSKTERLVDAIALLLGRTERLDDWAAQFYAARSQVAHEGSAQDRHYYSPPTVKQKLPSEPFGSLMLYGRRIFQLCLSTLLVGMDLADRADLQEKFVTNNERYQRICDYLKTNVGTPGERLLGIESTLRGLERYRFVSGRISTGTLISAVRHASKTLLELGCAGSMSQNLVACIESVANGGRQDGELLQLAAIERLSMAFSETSAENLAHEARIVRRLTEATWVSLFQRYYWLRERGQHKQ